MAGAAARVFHEPVRDLMHRPGEMRERSRTIAAPEHLGEGLAQVAQGAALDLSIKLESVHEGILATVEVATTYEAECGRCLKHFTAPHEVEFQELFAYTPTEADEAGVHGDYVDLEPQIRDAVVLALPFQPVCRPDCPGLDPETGELREQTDAEESNAAIDPRWAALQSFSVAEDLGVDESSAPHKQ